MNKLVIVGNGFDLAHKIKTSYKDFIYNYFRKIILNSIRTQASFKNDDLEISIKHIEPLIAYNYELPFSDGISDNAVMQILLNQTTFRIGNEYFANAFSCTIENSLVNLALQSIDDVKWVDIEEIYYDQLLERARAIGK